MEYRLSEHGPDEIAGAYARDGFVVLDGSQPDLTAALTEMLVERSGLTGEEVRAAGTRGGISLDAKTRARLARGDTTPELAATCLQALGPLLQHLIGPLVHVSQTFHYQLKARSQSEVILEGYSGDGREVESLYGVHNELTAARVLTSPNALVCWVALNDFDGSALYLYPGSHRLGLNTNRWLPRHEACPELERIGSPVEYRPRRGQLVLFHFLLMHGSGSAFRSEHSPGAPDPVRISCDLRFFPFCGILDSPARSLVPEPLAWIRERLPALEDDVLRAPLFETLAYLGQPVEWPALEDHSCVHWARFVEGLVRGDSAERHEALDRLVNTELGFDPLETYRERFEGVALQRRPYASIADGVPAARATLDDLAG